MYKIIVYELIIFKKPIANNKTITKKYFKKIFQINNITLDKLSEKMIMYKKIYKDNKYIIDFIKDDDFNYIEKLNKKSVKDYNKRNEV